MGSENDVDTYEALPDEFRRVESPHDLRFADVSDVRLDLAVDVELVAVDFRMRCDVFVVEAGRNGAATGRRRRSHRN